MSSITASRRMLKNKSDLKNDAKQQETTNDDDTNNSKSNKTNDNDEKSWSISQKLDVIILGDAYTGKTSYLNMLVDYQRNSNMPVTASQNDNEFEFWIQNSTKKAIFHVRDTASL
jgi:polynucleotide 5'-kinase involved in rRNA processing